MATPLPAHLTGLTDREAIADPLYRAVLAFDQSSESLLHSAVTEDLSAEMAGLSSQGIPDFKKKVYNRVSKLDTTHFLSNMRVNIESVTTAKATCSAMAQHVRPGKGFEPGPNKFTSGGLYACYLVMVGDLWKIKSWKANIVWVDGDRSVMSGE